jgi:hypothetical protein
VAQTAILYEEGLTPDADGFTAPGRAIWRLEEDGASPAIIGTIEVPARGILLTMRMSRNLDDALPATHLIEFSFDLSEAFPAKALPNWSVLSSSRRNRLAVTRLRGAIVDLGEGVFWQALAAGEADQAVNIPLAARWPLVRSARFFTMTIAGRSSRLRRAMTVWQCSSRRSTPGPASRLCLQCVDGDRLRRPLTEVIACRRKMRCGSILKACGASVSCGDHHHLMWCWLASVSTREARLTLSPMAE